MNSSFYRNPNQTEDGFDQSTDTPPQMNHAYKIDLASMNFDYEYGVVKGNNPNWMPVKIFNDSRQTFIEFPKLGLNVLDQILS